MDQGTELAKAVESLLKVCFNAWGPWGTVAIVLVFVLVLFGWHAFQLWRKDREVHLALQEKEKSIQRIAASERLWRAFYLAQQGWNDERIEKFLLRNEFEDGPQAREALEGGGRPPGTVDNAAQPKAPEPSKDRKDRRRR